MTDIEKLKEIYLGADVDSEDYQDNLDKITEWEEALAKSQDFMGWQKHDITKRIIAKAKETYKENAIRLGSDRNLTQAQRDSLFAKQDAIAWLINMAGEDYETVIKQINMEIKQVLAVT